MPRIPVALFLAATAVPASATIEVGDPLAGLQAMRELNLIVLHDMAGKGTVEGKAFVGGNLSNASALTVGAGNGKQGDQPSKRATLSVVGNVSGASLKLQNGPDGAEGVVGTPPALRVGGNHDTAGLDLVAQGVQVDVGGSIRNLNGSAGSTIRAGGKSQGYVNANGAKLELNLGSGFTKSLVQGLTAEQAALSADLAALSRQLSLLGTTKGNKTTEEGGRLTFDAADNGAGFSVFNMTADMFAFSEFDMRLASDGLTVVVNITGSDGYTWNANSVGGLNSSLNDNIIWNFAGAKKLEVNRATHGAVLATEASVRNTADMEGSLVAENLKQEARIGNGTYAGTGEFREPTDEGDGGDGGGPIGTVPEPATWAMMILGFGLVGAALRRRPVVLRPAFAG